ncbi:VanW family protein [Yaniella halotolerans]|uniref:VanW family protein n=1 Tax=Yaniella halotolerans TaxID=225453 RepID=UPI0003B3AD82|nr:VanW family protein [Yaniella halotolerans]
MADDKKPDPSEPTDNELDAESRMLQRIAALGDQRDPEANDDTPDAEPDTDPQEAVETPQGPETYDPPAPTEQTKMIHPVAAGGGSTGSEDPPKAKRKRRRWPWVVVVLLLLLGIGYVGVAFATENDLPATLTVEGVDVSGKTVDEAAPVIEEELAARAERELVVSAADAEASIVPAEAGYSYDVDATLNDLTELTFDPVELWGRIFGEAHVDVATSVDEAAAEDAVAGLAEQLTYDPTEGSVVYEGESMDYSEPINGFTVDSEQLSNDLSANWLGSETEMEAPGEAVAPNVSQEQWDTFVADTAQPLVDDIYTVTADDATAQLTPAQLGEAAEVRVEEGEDGDAPVLSLDGDTLTDALAQNSDEFESTNQDASIELTGSAGSASPEVIPGSSGRGVDGEQVVDEILADLNGEQTRSVSVELHEVEPEITTEEAEAWDVNHVVAEYATPYPASDGPRTANLEIGAQRVNGTVVMPGDEFNLNALLAPITAANGYHSSGVVESGVTTEALGGGLSQIATMSYNAGFLGGMDIVEHKPHSRWFDRYPQGRESTYWEGQINVRWANDTDAPVIVEMWLDGSQVHTRLWGSDYYDIATSTSEPYNFTASPTIRSTDEECISESGGDRGFTVDVNRTKTPPSGEAVQESWSWAYSGWPTVICE